jgi:hypothetical protein
VRKKKMQFLAVVVSQTPVTFVVSKTHMMPKAKEALSMAH